MLRDVGQVAEGQLFGILFGDSEGRGGKGLTGSSFKGDNSKPNAGGLVGAGLSGLMGMFNKKQPSPTSNGGLGSGAGTIPSAAASLAQMGKAASGSGGVQVTINNTGTPQTVTSSQSSTDQAGNFLVQLFMQDLNSNGPMTQGIMGKVQS
jgi:hypothetical protein